VKKIILVILIVFLSAPALASKADEGCGVKVILTKEECDYASGWGISCHSNWRWKSHDSCSYKTDKKCFRSYEHKEQCLLDILEAMESHKLSEFRGRITTLERKLKDLENETVEKDCFIFKDSKYCLNTE